MKKIVEAEKEAQRILEQTNHEIAKMKNDLPNRITSMREQILKEATEQRRQIVLEAEKAGAKEAKQIAFESSKQLQALSQIPEARRKRAVEAVVQLLIS
jgi:vacuolar-type H+-ATPase subunit H